MQYTNWILFLLGMLHYLIVPVNYDAGSSGIVGCWHRCHHHRFVEPDEIVVVGGCGGGWWWWLVAGGGGWLVDRLPLIDK